MESVEGGQAVLDHEVILVGPPAKDGHSFQEEGEAIWAGKGSEVVRGAAILDRANQVGQAFWIIRGQSTLQVVYRGEG